MNRKNSILIVEDEKNIASLIDKSLRREGFHTIIAHDGERALQLAREYEPIFVVLDLMLPKMNGWEVCRRLREESDVPILMLTAKEGEVDKLCGFSLGADDYVVKPFSPRELIERVKAILRRTRNACMCRKAKLSFGNLLLVQDFQKLTLAEAAKVYLRREEIQLSHLVKRVIELYRHDFEVKGIRVNLDFNGEPCAVQADRDKIVQALGNIVQNAWRYTPEQGEFRVRAEGCEKYVKIIFSNTYHEFPKEDVGLIFERFYRVEKSRSRDSGGAGIGLAIVKALVEAHGGEVGAWYDEDAIHIWLSLPA